MEYNSRYLLYLHRLPITNCVFYIGIGTRKRAFDFRGRNYLWKRYVHKYGRPIVEIYKSELNLLEASYLEMFFIEKLGRVIDGSGVLTNISIGGFAGAKGVKQTAEHIKKRIKDGQIEKLACINRGRKFSQERKEEISESSKEMWSREGFKENMRSKSIGKIRNRRSVIRVSDGKIFHSAKEAAVAQNIKKGYFTAMIGGFFTNKTGCLYLNTRPFKSGKERKCGEHILIKN